MRCGFLNNHSWINIFFTEWLLKLLCISKTVTFRSIHNNTISFKAASLELFSSISNWEGVVTDLTERLRMSHETLLSTIWRNTSIILRHVCIVNINMINNTLWSIFTSLLSKYSWGGGSQASCLAVLLSWGSSETSSLSSSSLQGVVEFNSHPKKDLKLPPPPKKKRVKGLLLRRNKWTHP